MCGSPTDQLATYALKGSRALVGSFMYHGAFRRQQSACDICAERPKGGSSQLAMYRPELILLELSVLYTPSCPWVVILL